MKSFAQSYMRGDGRDGARIHVIALSRRKTCEHYKIVKILPAKKRNRSRAFDVVNLTADEGHLRALVSEWLADGFRLIGDDDACACK